MNLKVIGKDSKEVGTKKLPSQFDEPLRGDLIKRAVLAIQSNSRQAYGADPRAGKRHSDKVSRRRRKYRGGYGAGMARLPRKILSRKGTRFNWVASRAPNAVGGRSPNAPTAEKNYDLKVNDKERRKAIRSALSATVDREIVVARGHRVPESYPLILSNDFETISKTKEFVTALDTLGFSDELVRSSKKTIRAGKGTMRNRKYKKRIGPLVVVSTDSNLKSVSNVPGVDLIKVTELNTQLLAPGCHFGRAVLFTQKAMEELESKKLYI